MHTTKPYPKPLAHNRLPLVHCKCGTDILVIPDVKAMDKAIETHLAICSIVKQFKNKKECADELSDYLIKQVFDVAAAEVKSEKNSSQEEHYSKRTPLFYYYP